MKRTGIMVLLLLVVPCFTACTQPAADPGAASVVIVEPEDGALVMAGELVTFRSLITVPAGVTRVDLIANGELIRSDVLTVPLQNGSVVQAWRPEAEGDYAIQVAAAAGESYAASAQVSIRVGARAEEQPAFTVTPSVDPTWTALPDTPAQTVTPPPQEPMAEALTTANCRSGDNTVFPVATSLRQGETAPIAGRNQASTWWFISWNGLTCWVSDDLIGISGDTGSVPVLASPPTPTPSEEPLAAPAPLSPQGGIKCADTTGGITLSWSEVIHSSGISGYEWQIEGGGLERSGMTEDTQVQVHTIACFETYTWKVRALEAGGAPGPYSVEAVFIAE